MKWCLGKGKGKKEKKKRERGGRGRGGEEKEEIQPFPISIADAEIPEGTVPAAFGENIVTYGLTEDTLCVGDILKLGSATVQISQGRQPCWKVSEFTKNKRMA